MENSTTTLEKFKTPIKYTLIFMVICGLLALLADRCNRAKSDADVKASLEHYIHDSTSFEIKRQKDSTQLISQRQMILDLKTAQALKLVNLSNEVENLRHLNQQLTIKSTTTINIDTPTAYIGNTIVNVLYHQEDTLADYLQLPYSFQDSNKFYNLKVDITETLKAKFNLYNTQTVSWGISKFNFLKMPQPVVQVHNSNPFITTESVTNYSEVYRYKWYDNKWFWFSLGIITGSAAGVGGGYAAGHH